MLFFKPFFAFILMSHFSSLAFGQWLPWETAFVVPNQISNQYGNPYDFNSLGALTGNGRALSAKHKMESGGVVNAINLTDNELGKCDFRIKEYLKPKVGHGPNRLRYRYQSITQVHHSMPSNWNGGLVIYKFEHTNMNETNQGIRHQTREISVLTCMSLTHCQLGLPLGMGQSAIFSRLIQTHLAGQNDTTDGESGEISVKLELEKRCYSGTQEVNPSSDIFQVAKKIEGVQLKSLVQDAAPNVTKSQELK
jgi:hypothetical protein